jgi:hypothetical protein
LILQYNQSPGTPPEELSDEEFLKAYRGSLACEARLKVVYQSAVEEVAARIFPKSST